MNSFRDSAGVLHYCTNEVAMRLRSVDDRSGMYWLLIDEAKQAGTCWPASDRGAA